MMKTASPSNPQELWEQTLSLIQGRLPQQSFETWFKPLVLESIEDRRFRVILPNRFFKEWFEEHYLSLLKAALRELLSGEVEVTLLLPEKEVAAPRSRSEAPVKRPRRGKEPSTVLNPRYTFDTFVVGSSNQLAHAGALAVAEQPAKAYNPLFIYGGVGLGKTHLLHAVGHRALEKHAGMSVAYVSSEKFMNDLINAIRFDATPEFRSRYRNLDILLVDDIQFIAGKERTQEEFFHTFNDLYDSAKQIVISSDSLPREIPTLEERLRSRFEWGLIADIQPPDLETKAAILRKKAEVEGARIPDEVSLFVANKVQSNIRELEGSLIRLIAYASLTGREIDLPLAQEVLRDIAEERERLITPPVIQQAVAEFYSVSVEDLKSKGRHKSIVLPRQVAMYLCRTLTNSSLPDIGQAFGGKDHTTVMHACEKIKRRVAEDDAFRRQIENLAASIGR